MSHQQQTLLLFHLQTSRILLIRRDSGVHQAFPSRSITVLRSIGGEREKHQWLATRALILIAGSPRVTLCQLRYGTTLPIMFPVRHTSWGCTVHMYTARIADVQLRLALSLERKGMLPVFRNRIHRAHNLSASCDHLCRNVTILFRIIVRSVHCRFLPTEVHTER